MGKKEVFLSGFLDKPFEIKPLAYGMSFRTYDRVVVGDDSYVLMNVPTEKPLEDGQNAVDGVIRPFLAIQGYLKEQGIKVPEVYAVDEMLGKVLIEDFGDDTFYDMFCQNPVSEDLYKKAIHTLVKLYTAKEVQGVEHYKVELACVRGEFFLEDYLPAVTGQESSAAQFQELNSILEELYETVKNVKWGTILWDYHSPNLMEVKGDVGVLDFQDAKYGPLSYDLASLLYDARYPFPKSMREEMFNYFVECVGIEDVSSFRDSFEIVGLLRNLGILGRFARSFYRDGKVEFLPKIAVLWPYMEEALENPKAACLKDFLEKNMPRRRLLTA